MNNENNLYSLNSEGKFLYIRHGQTLYNKDCLTKNESEIKCMPDYIDSELSKEGINQSKKLQKIVNKFDIQQVYVSPLYRAIETCSIALENHPQKKNFTVIINPLCTEMVNGAQDVIYNIQKTKNKFNMKSNIKFDWSLFDNCFKNKFEQDSYYFNYIDNLTENQKKEQFNILYNSYNKKTFKQNVANLCKYGKNLGLNRLESLKHMWNRCIEFKQFLLNKYKSKLNENNKKILIFTHNSFCKISSSLISYNLDVIDNFPEDCYNIKNCEIISMNIQEAIKIVNNNNNNIKNNKIKNIKKKKIKKRNYKEIINKNDKNEISKKIQIPKNKKLK